MKTFITSDLHFGHANIMKFCPVSRARFRNDVNYMNETMVSEWNAWVGPEDLVYILGDVAFLPAARAREYMQRCQGRKILVQGNHDRKLLEAPDFRSCFESVHHYLDVTYQGTNCVMFHYPIAEWDRMHRGSVHFHGHLHGNASGLEKFRARDMGMDATGRIVVELPHAIADALTGAIKSHH